MRENKTMAKIFLVNYFQCKFHFLKNSTLWALKQYNISKLQASHGHSVGCSFSPVHAQLPISQVRNTSHHLRQILIARRIRFLLKCNIVWRGKYTSCYSLLIIKWAYSWNHVINSNSQTLIDHLALEARRLAFLSLMGL